MTALILIFLGSLLLGQIGAISVWPGVTVYVHDLVLVVLLVCGVWAARQKKLRQATLATPIFLFAGAGVISLLVNLWRFPLADVFISSLYLVRWVAYALAYIIVFRLLGNPRLWTKGLYGVGVAFGMLGLLQFFLYPDLRNLMYLGWDPHYYRLFSTFLDPNFMGLFLVLTFMLGFALWQERKTRFILFSGQTITFIALLLTYSRSSYLAFAAAVLAWAIVRKQWKILLGIALFAIVVILLPRTSGSTLSLLRSDSTIARIGNWQQSLERIGRAPIFGYGFDTLRFLTPAAQTGTVSKSAAGVDSSILFVAATTGIVGLAAFGVLIFSMIRLGMTAMKNKKSVLLGSVYLSGLVALAVHSLFTNSMFYPWVMVWFWIMSGTIEKSRDPSASSG